jgi:hypothetical protein
MFGRKNPDSNRGELEALESLVERQKARLEVQKGRIVALTKTLVEMRKQLGLSDKGPYESDD